VALLSNLGICLTEIAWLDPLADDCAADGQWDFLYVAAPLKVVGASGAPIKRRGKDGGRDRRRQAVSKSPPVMRDAGVDPAVRDAGPMVTADRGPGEHVAVTSKRQSQNTPVLSCCNVYLHVGKHAECLLKLNDRHDGARALPASCRARLMFDRAEA